jgi:hypothetical protein
MTKKSKVRATLGGVLVGAAGMFIGLAGQDAQAPPNVQLRLVKPAVHYVDDDLAPCPAEALTTKDCRAARKAER